MKKLACILLTMMLAVSLSTTAFAAETVAQQIQSLPTAEEYAAMDKEAQVDVYNRTQYAYDVYKALTEEERNAIDGAEEKFEALFTYFNEQIMALTPEGGSGKRSYNSFAWVLILAMAVVLFSLVLRKKKM